jgi:hypothetical protein
VDEDSFKFSCPFCSQHVRAYEEHCGDTIECPGCAEEFIVPLRSLALKNEYGLNSELPRLFDDEELDQLYNESSVVHDMLIGATNMNCWEFKVTAHLMRNHLAMLENVLAEHMDEAILTKPSGTPEDAKQFLDLAQRQFSGAFDKTYLILLTDLTNAMYRDSVTDIVKMVQGVGKQAGEIESAYRNLVGETVPEMQPVPRMVEIMKEWAVHYWSTVAWVADQLEHLADQPGRKREFQVSLVPPTIAEYYQLRSSLDH